MMAILWVFKACSVFGSDVSKKVRLQAHTVQVKLSLCIPGKDMDEYRCSTTPRSAVLTPISNEQEAL